MLDNETIVKVKNRGHSIVGYMIPELHIKRRFSPSESKQLTVGEMRALYAERGGAAIIRNHLVIDNEELVNELIYNVQPEYFYSEEDVVNLLLNGTEDQLYDAIEFGPSGIHDIIKAKAVELKLNDVRKRAIILEKLDFNVDSAIMANSMDTPVTHETKGRRAEPITAMNKEEAFKASTSRYRVVNKTNE